MDDKIANAQSNKPVIETGPKPSKQATESVAAQGEPINRAPRSHDDRTSEARPADDWKPPSTLPVPDPQPGWLFRYIRISNHGASDASNAAKRFREGWEVVKAADCPELAMQAPEGSRWPDGVEVGGLLLCKIPERIVKQRNAYYQNVARQQIETVDNNYMKQQDPRMPLISEKSTRTNSFREG